MIAYKNKQWLHTKTIVKVKELQSMKLQWIAYSIWYCYGIRFYKNKNSWEFKAYTFTIRRFYY